MNDLARGRCSGIPECCIAYYISLTDDRRVAEPDLGVEYVPCPDCVRAERFVKILICTTETCTCGFAYRQTGETMIRPDEVYPSSNKRNARLAAIEEQFDDAIRKAEATGEWPAIVRHKRDGANAKDVDTVVAKYCKAGWRFGDDHNYRAIILRPVTSSAEPA